MTLTRKDLEENVQNHSWVKAFIDMFLPNALSVMEKGYRYWHSDRESEPGEQVVEHFDEKGIVLWRFDEKLVTDKYEIWKEVVLFESGSFYLLHRSHTWGAVRADFEAYADTETRGSNMYPLSVENFEKYRGRIADELLQRAQRHEDVAKLAYQYWEGRGCPHGSPKEDWFRAEKDLR